MKKIKGFNEFLFEGLEDTKEVKLSASKYQHKLQKFYKKSGYNLYYASTFNTATLVLIPLIEQIFNCSIEESIMLTVFSISVLTKESKDKVEKLHTYLIKHEIDDDKLEKTINILTNVYEIFKSMLKVGEKQIKIFSDMLSHTGILVPFLNVFGSLIGNGFLDIELISQPLQNMKDELGEDRFKLLVHRILHKLNIITDNDHKFQNKDNVKPLKVNDELKGPMAQTEDVILEKKSSITIPDDLALWFMNYYASQVMDFIKIDDIPEYLFKGSFDFINSDSLFRGESRESNITNPINFSPTNNAGIAWSTDKLTAMGFIEPNPQYYSYLYKLDLNKIKYPISMDYVMNNITKEQIQLITNPITRSIFDGGYISENEVLVFDTFSSDVLSIIEVDDDLLKQKS